MKDNEIIEIKNALAKLSKYCGKTFNGENKCGDCDFGRECKEIMKGDIPELWAVREDMVRWRAKPYDTFYFVNIYKHIECAAEHRTNGDNNLYRYRNYFASEEEAKKYKRVLETELLFREYAEKHNKFLDWDNSMQKKWYVEYDYYDGDLRYTYTATLSNNRIIYFSSEELLDEAVNAIGINRIEEYLKYEW